MGSSYRTSSYAEVQYRVNRQAAFARMEQGKKGEIGAWKSIDLMMRGWGEGEGALLIFGGEVWVKARG
jgi:hypothetical protein